MSIKTVSDRIILIPQKPADNIGGVLIPDASKLKPAKGIVTSVGPDCREVKEGYEILFLEGHGVAHQEGETEYLIIKEQDVLCYSQK